MTDGGNLEISSFDELPEMEKPLSVLVPTLEEVGRQLPVTVEVGSDVSLTRSLFTEIQAELGLTEQDMQAHLHRTFGDQVEIGEEESAAAAAQSPDVLRAALTEDYTLPSSLVRPGDRWQIIDIAPQPEGVARISFGRRGRDELAMTVAEDSVGGFRRGDPLIGAETLWQGRSGILGLGRVEVRFVPDPDQPEPVPIWIPLMRLHRPQVDGCKATYTSKSGDFESLGMTLKILGVGAEGGFKVGVSLLDEYVANSACVETVIPANLQWRPGKTLVNGTEVSYGLHAKVIDIDVDKQKDRPVPSADDDCERSPAELDGLATKPYDESESPLGDTRASAIGFETATYGRLSVGLEMGGGVPVKVGMDYQRETQRSTALRVDLVGGRRYWAYAPVRHVGADLGQHLEICWSANG